MSGEVPFSRLLAVSDANPVIGKLQVFVRRNLGHVATQAVRLSSRGRAIGSTVLFGVVTLQADSRVETPVALSRSMRVVTTHAVKPRRLTVRQSDLALLQKTGALYEPNRCEAGNGPIVLLNWPAHFVRAAMAFTAAVDGFMRRHPRELLDGGRESGFHFVDMLRRVPVTPRTTNARLYPVE